MSDIPAPPLPLPPRGNPPSFPPPPRRSSGSVLGTFFALSLILNIVFFILLIVVCAGALIIGNAGSASGSALREKHYSGQTSASDKVAIVHVDGVILEGFTGFDEKQIATAAEDSAVKAVVLRINSPGGSITASDDLYRRLSLLRKGDPDKGTPPKPLVVSMGALAASGGYYIAMPGQTIYAERTTLTGSIGVYAAFPNVKGLGDKYGVKMEVIKKGNVKDSGSMFHTMTPEERAVWQDMVDTAYEQFKAVVEEGRPSLKGKLEDKVVDEQRVVPGEDGKPEHIQFVRQLADGGVFTADKAKEFKLIDAIGYLDDAVKEAAKLAGLGSNYEAISYRPPPTPMDLLLGEKANPPASALDPSRLANGLTPRLWYLAPQSELAGIMAASGN
jgi:protease IV